MIETTQLIPGVTLQCCRDARFKHSCLSLQLIRPMTEAEAAMNALIPAVLLRGTRRMPSLRDITIGLDDLYGASVSPLVRRVGDYQTTGLYCSMMDDRFALPGDKVLEPMIAFLGELLLDSPTEDGGFLAGFVESEKKNLISTIESELNDKRVYAMNRLLRTMCREDSFGIPRMGDKEQVQAVTPQALYAHWQQSLRTSPVLIFYVGSAPAEEVARLLLPLFRNMDRDYIPAAPQSDFRSAPGLDLTETMDLTQGKLCMGFTTPITNRTSDFPAMQLLNTIFGAGMTSKLFQNIREKQSLCYAIHSGYYATKGLMVVSAGIDFDKETHVRQEVLAQLEDCRRGNITIQEIIAAREALISGLRAANDSPSAIESYYATAALGGTGMTTEEYIRAVEAVTPEQIVAAAKTVTLHSTYFLKGADQ